MRKILLSSCLLLTLLAACTSPPRGSPANGHPWAEALRALDPAEAANPAHDVTAVYMRRGNDGLQIRVDLLGFQTANDLSLEIKIGDDSSLEAVPLTIHIPSEDSPARISLDPLLATVIVDVPQSAIPSRPRVDVSTPEDAITSLTLDGPVPVGTAPLLLAFYDTFAGRFPAEALRRWDGAHSGPRGERHGLKHLLDAAAEHQVPIVLLDLKEPENLSALDAMGVLPQIQQLEQESLLLSPDQPEQEVLFGFSPSQFTWGETGSRPTFVFSDDLTHIYHSLFSRTTFIPIAKETDSNQPTPDGPSLEVRRALLETALNVDEKDLLVLGGSLRDSTWGSPDMAGASMAYFASRPYIHALTADDLRSFPVISGRPALRPSPLDESIDKLEAHYETMTWPVMDFVKAWKGSPLSSCNSDLDKDNQPECILANEHILAILDPRGGRLTYLFSVGRVGREASQKGGNPPYTQFIGPSWQVAAGLSSPSLWDLSAGEAADPGAYPGAFADADDPFKPYEPAIDGHTIVFTALDGTRAKTFSFNGNAIEVTYQTQEPVITQIPLLVDPGTRFTPGWAEKYVQEKTPGGIAWGLENGPMVRVQFEGPLEMRAFNESLSMLANPEDPDFDYPAGHFVPFPMAIIDIQMDGATSTIQISVSP